MFIVSCGLTHVMEVVTLWQPYYWASGGLKALTAVASMATAALLVPLLPRALKLPSPKMLQAANEQLELQRLMVHHMKKGLVLVRERDQLVVFTNPHFDSLVGAQPGELLNQPSASLNHAGDSSRAAELRERFRTSTHEVAFDITLKRRDGRPVFCHATTVGFEHPEHGRVWATHFEERNTDRRNLMADLVQTTGEAAVTVSLTGLVETWNQGAERLYGHLEADAVGQPFEALTGARLALPPLEAGSAVAETQHRSKQGSVLDVVVTTSSIRDRTGAVTAVAALIHDLSERKRAERALAESLLEKESLLKEVHHRVKNNLQIVSSLLNLQRDSIEAPEAKEALATAHARVHAISRLHEFIYQAKNLGSVPLGGYLKELVDSIARTHELVGRPVELRVNASEVSVGLSQGVPLTLILNELLTNSFKHAFPTAHEGPRVITVEGRRVDGDCEVVIADTGIGLPDQPAATKRLGLQLVRTLVRQLAGSLTTHPATGAHWALRFPVKEAHES